MFPISRRRRRSVRAAGLLGLLRAGNGSGRGPERRPESVRQSDTPGAHAAPPVRRGEGVRSVRAQRELALSRRPQVENAPHK